MNLPPVSPLINNSFNLAKAKYREEHAAWTRLSARLSGRFNLPVAMMNIQRQGDLDLLLRCMEDEHAANGNVEGAEVNTTFHYQLLLSEAWVVGCYEILRAFRQRDSDALKVGARQSGISEMDAFKSIFADFELLRMPMAKFEIAKDVKLKQPLPLQRLPPNNDATDHVAYDRDNPARSHLMPTSMSLRGSMCWLAIDHLNSRQYWVERRNLGERLLALGEEIVPAGILEAQERTAQQL